MSETILTPIAQQDPSVMGNEGDVILVASAPRNGWSQSMLEHTT
ncbi:hypothetical protein [Marinobacter sp.]|nr:hypothetical protein [Marinobacter sp.]